MKKYLSFCLILAMLVSLVACGGTAPEQTQPEETVPGEHIVTDAGITHHGVIVHPPHIPAEFV